MLPEKAVENFSSTIYTCFVFVVSNFQQLLFLLPVLCRLRLQLMTFLQVSTMNCFFTVQQPKNNQKMSAFWQALHAIVQPQSVELVLRPLFTVGFHFCLCALKVVSSASSHLHHSFASATESTVKLKKPKSFVQSAFADSSQLSK